MIELRHCASQDEGKIPAGVLRLGGDLRVGEAEENGHIR